MSFVGNFKAGLFGKDGLQPKHKAVGMKRCVLYRGQAGGLRLFSQF